MNPKTEAKLAQIATAAKTGQEIIPMFFRGFMESPATISAAIRVAIARNIIVECGKDGCGKPKYRGVIPAATHAGTGAIN